MILLRSPLEITIGGTSELFPWVRVAINKYFHVVVKQASVVYESCELHPKYSMTCWDGEGLGINYIRQVSEAFKEPNAVPFIATSGGVRYSVPELHYLNLSADHLDQLESHLLLFRIHRHERCDEGAGEKDEEYRVAIRRIGEATLQAIADKRWRELGEYAEQQFKATVTKKIIEMTPEGNDRMLKAKLAGSYGVFLDNEFLIAVAPPDRHDLVIQMTKHHKMVHHIPIKIDRCGTRVLYSDEV